MKKVFLMIMLTALLCSCSYHYTDRGLENFSVNDSSVGLCRGLLPDDFMDEFSYANGDYFYSANEESAISFCEEKVLIYLQYDNIVYQNAKKHAMDNLMLSESVAIYNGYFFYNNDTPASLGNDHLDSKNYPYEFVRFAYNDNNNTLIFMGFSVTADLQSEVDEVADDWGAFLEKYYGEWYSFS